jgi:hypothetical protein
MGTNGAGVITGNLIPSISNGGPAKRRSKVAVATTPTDSNLPDKTAANAPLTPLPNPPQLFLQSNGLQPVPIASQGPGSQLTLDDLVSGPGYNFNQMLESLDFSGFGDMASSGTVSPPFPSLIPFLPLPPLPQGLDLNLNLSPADLDLVMGNAAVAPNPTA